MTKTCNVVACGLAMVLAVMAPTSILLAADNAPAGWRGDGSGAYPSAKPPTEWAADKNIVWATTMPSWSNSSPIIVGDKILVGSELATLVCCNLADGKILWQKDNPFDDCASAEDKAKMDEATKSAAPLGEELKAAGKAEGDAFKAFNEAKDPAQKAELKKTYEAAQKNTWAIRGKLAPLQAIMPGKQNLGYATAGYSTPTPVSDGKLVYIHSAMRIVACYDLEGNRKWARVTDQFPDGRGHSTSPLLIGDRLFVHVRDLVAYDKNTGKELWRTPTGWGWGSLSAARIGQADVVITPKGAIVNAADGKALGGLGVGTDSQTPVVKGDLVYVVRDNGAVVKLPATSDAPMKVQRVCGLASKIGGFASPVVLDGLIYTSARKDVPGKPPLTMLQVMDAATGAMVYEKDMAFAAGKEMEPYPSVSQAGKYLFVSCESGETVVVEPGREYKEVARNKLGDNFRCCPVAQGDRLYIRGMKKLYCIGK